MTKKEMDYFICDWAGKVLEIVGVLGAIAVMCFDYLARGIAGDFGWAQFLGVIFFVTLSLFGSKVDSFLGSVKEVLKEYL
jgi:uncharacterized membrane protein